MRVILATSPHVRHPAVLQNDFVPDPSAMYTFAPVGLLALAAIVRSEFHEDPVLFDLNRHIINGRIPLDATFYRSAAEQICAHEPDVFGFMTECDSYHHVLQITEQVKRLRPACVCVLGGPHASAVARPTMERCAYVDAIVVGEGERTFPDLLAAVAERRGGSVPGALMRTGPMAFVDGGARPLAASLDELPMPAYDLYHGSPEEEVFIEAGRGCPFKCTFCSTAPFWQRRHRVKSPGRILEEIRVVQERFGSRRVHFTHDLLTTDKRWVADLCHTLIAAGTPVKWTCSARTDTVDRTLLELMATAGCSAIYFGVESGSARILHEIQKDIPIDESLEVLRQCRAVGIRPNAGFIAGFPTEDRASLHDTFEAFERALGIGARPTHVFGFCPFAASSMSAGLTGLTCDGHFLDIPMDPELDAANRARIAADPQLFGSYFRPRVDVTPTRLEGVDEFSCLVENVALPALTLSRLVGGMLEVYDRWTRWIERRNVEAGAAPHRRFYGSALAFCEFVVDELERLVGADDPMLQLAEIMRVSFDVARRWATVPRALTIATYRSLDRPEIGRPIRLEDSIRSKAIVATRRVDYDLVPLIDASPEDAVAPERKPSYLMWDLADEGRIRLSEIDSFLYDALERLRCGPQPVASLMLEWMESRGEPLDAARVINVLSEAKTLQIVETL